MATQAWLIFTPAQRAAVITASASTDYKVAPRVINNPLVANMGDAVLATGNSVAPASILSDPDYSSFWYASLSGLPIRVLDSDVLFLPPEG